MDYNSSALSTWMKNFLDGLSKCPVWGQSNRRGEQNLPLGFMCSITSEEKKKERVCRDIIISILLSCRHIHALHEMYFETMPHGLWDIYKGGSIKSRCSSVRSSLDWIVVIACKSLFEFSETSLTLKLWTPDKTMDIWLSTHLWHVCQKTDLIKTLVEEQW